MSTSSFNETINSASDTIKSISNDYPLHVLSEFISDIINNYEELELADRGAGAG